MGEAPDLLTPQELVVRWKFKISIRTLDDWRSTRRKSGPAWQKIGGRVFYPTDFVIEYEEDQTCIPKQKKRVANVKNAASKDSKGAA